MTTVAWDGKILAGDTQATRACMKNRTATKVFRVVDNLQQVRLVGHSGDEGICLQVQQWIANGMPETDRPRLERDSYTAILVTREGAFRLDSCLTRIPLQEYFHAIGNGRDFAMAAMHLGKNAVEAVELACLYDCYTSGPVTSVQLDGE